MKKLLNILLVHRTEVKNKWWHRLANVLIFGSTAIIVLFAAVIFYPDEFFWKKYSYTAFSFEPNYTEAKGSPVYCTYYDYPDNYFMCGEHSVPDITKRFNRAMREKYESDGIACEKLKQEEVGTPLGEFKAGMCERSKKDFYAIEIRGHENETKDFYGNTMLKVQIAIVWSTLLDYVGIVLVSTLGWFIFWESLIYRTILYIIYGKKNNPN